MRYVSLMHTKRTKEKTVKDIMNAVAAINLRPNWWGCQYGRDLMYAVFKEKKVVLPEDSTEQSLVQLMHDCLFKDKVLVAGRHVL